MTYQSPESLNSILEKLFKSNSSRSLSGIFKALRKEPRVELVGDYHLITYILKYGYSRSPKYVWNRNQVLRTVKISDLVQEEGRKQSYIPNEWKQYLK